MFWKKANTFLDCYGTSYSPKMQNTVIIPAVLSASRRRRQNTVQVIPCSTDMRRQENKIRTKLHFHTSFTLKKNYYDPETFLNMSEKDI